MNPKLFLYFIYLNSCIIRAQASHKKEEKKSDKQSEKEKDPSKTQEVRNKKSDSVPSNAGADSSKKEDKKRLRKIPPLFSVPGT